MVLGADPQRQPSPRYYLTWYALQSVLMKIVCAAGIVGQVS